MLISTKHLKAAGCMVRVTANGVKSEADLLIEIEFENAGRLPDGMADAIEELVGSELGPAVFDALSNKIHSLQVLERIRNTEAKAWRDRNHKK